MPKHIVDTLGSQQFVTDTLTMTTPMRTSTLATATETLDLADASFVQQVSYAGWTLPSAIYINSNGDVGNIESQSAQNRHLTQRIYVSAFSGKATIVLKVANTRVGDFRRLIVVMPVGCDQTIEIRNKTETGRLLGVVPNDGSVARTWVGYSCKDGPNLDGTGWGDIAFAPMDLPEYTRSFSAYRGDYIYSDGLTANRAIVQGDFNSTSKKRGWFAGLSSVTWRGSVPVPMSSSTGEIASCSSSTTSLSSATAWSMGIAWNVDDLVIRCNGANVSTDYRTYTIPNARIVYSGQTILLRVLISGGTAAPVVYINFNLITSVTYADIQYDAVYASGSGTAPSWLSSSLVTTYHKTGYNYPAGIIPNGSWIIGSVTSTESITWTNYGQPPAWITKGGSAVLVTSGSLVIGTKYRINSYSSPDSFTNVGASSNATGVEFIATGTTPTSWANSSALIALGAVSISSIQSVYVVDDLTNIGSNIGQITNGMTPVSTKTESFIRADVTSTGYIHGNNSNLIPTGYQISDIWVTANGTVSLGGSSGSPTEIFSSFTPVSSTAWTRVVDPGATSVKNLYATLGTATSASFKIKVIPNSANTSLVSTSGVALNTKLNINGGTASTSTTTGALVVNGGAGVSGSVFVGGSLELPIDGNSIKFSNSGSNGQILSSGGSLTISNNAGTSGSTTISIRPASDRKIEIGPSSGFVGSTTITYTTSSTSTTTGALIVKGGVGVAERVVSQFVSAGSTIGSDIITGGQVGVGYSHSTAAVYAAVTDNPNTGAANLAFRAFRTGDAYNRFSISMDGTLSFGIGSGTQDVNLYRSTASKLEIGGSLNVTGHLSAATKAFVIPHPTKVGKKLQYACLEGPENGVYVRGKTSETIITLPEYWDNLVDSESVTVTLTPIGKFQPLYVTEQNSTQITVDGVDGEYNYVVYGERKDVAKLETEI